MARRPMPSTAKLPVAKPLQYPNASQHYGLLWWNNADGSLKQVPKESYWSWGLYESLIVVIPSLDIVAARAGSSWQPKPTARYDILAPFLEAIAASVSPATKSTSPYPPSPAIAQLTWADASTIVRQAKGSDNWPMTWGDDDLLYTAYGDGWGFDKPGSFPKLSLGIARIKGIQQYFVGTNLRSATIEHTGDGPKGKKASGMLMIDGVLYMWVRNAGNAQLAWSENHGKNWTFNSWKLTTSFGCPTFCNYGKNCNGASDEYVYVYSPDSDSAYQPVDQMVLARVHKKRITDRNAYEFFKRLSSDGKVEWTKSIAQRKAVFKHINRCYRSSVCYHPILKRYLWCQVMPAEDKQSHGGIGIYDAPKPWGPWTTVYYDESWDVDPGESAGFVTKWISRDGKTLYLVFSGNDSFSVRKATLTFSAGG